jgi:hypothetical protein
MQSIHIRNYYNISLSSLRADPIYDCNIIKLDSG